MWYSFNYASAHFVILNTETDFPGAHEENEGDSKLLPAGHFAPDGEYMRWLEADLAEVETSLPPEIRPDYDRIVKTRRDDSMASVNDGICEGCFQQITPNMIAQLTLKESVICNSCGRLLYPASSD